MKKNTSSFLIFSVLLLICVTIILFQIKHKVQPISKEIYNISLEIVKIREDIHILNAELSYITKLESLNMLTKRNLKLESINPRSVISVDVNNLDKIRYKLNGNEETQ